MATRAAALKERLQRDEKVLIEKPSDPKRWAIYFIEAWGGSDGYHADPQGDPGSAHPRLKLRHGHTERGVDSDGETEYSWDVGIAP